MTSQDDCCAHEQASVTRRDMLCGGGAVLFGVLIESLLSGARPARAAALTGSVPEVDRLAVRVVIDNYHFAITPSTKSGHVEIERYGFALSDQPPHKAIISEFGLSLHAESQRGGEMRNVLLDFGFTPEALLNNIDLLDIDPGALDGLVLSHGHYDHFGGLAGFLQQTKGKTKPRIPLYIGGEECFCSREWAAPPMPGNFGALDRKALEQADLVVTYAEQPSLMADHAFTMGQIGLTTFEQVLAPTKMKIGVQDGIGCFADKFSEEERTKAIIPDQFRHEIATAYNLKGRGLVVLTACSHRGVVNHVKAAQAASGVRKVHAIIGGFHLAPYKEDYVRNVIAALKEIDPDYIIPLHCSGEPFYEMTKAEMPTKLLRGYTGTRFIFSA